MHQGIHSGWHVLCVHFRLVVCFFASQALLMHIFTDMTRSLQQKHQLAATPKSQNALLESLNALDDSKRLSPISDKVEVVVEPAAALPLWRRVDRHFWWNEWMSKPFIDAGVRGFSQYCDARHSSPPIPPAPSLRLTHHAGILPSFVLRDCPGTRRCGRGPQRRSRVHRNLAPFKRPCRSSIPT